MYPLPRLTYGESSEACLSVGLVCSIYDNVCTECGEREV